MLHLIRSKDFDFLGNAKKFMLFSGIATVACLAVLFVRGQRNLGADFRGGDLMVLSAAQKLTPDQIALAKRLVTEGTSVPEIAKILNVHRATLYRALHS